MMVLSGALAITWLGYERKRRGSFTKRKAQEEEGEFDVSKFLRGLSYLGLVLGVFVIWSGVMGLILDIPPSFQYRDVTGNHANHFTCTFLIVVGIAMFFKPIADLPLSSILGLIVATVVTFIIAIIVPDGVVQWIGGFINPKWLLVIIFIIITVIVALTAKFYIGMLQKISKFLSWPPIAFIIVIFCFVQGFCLWIGGFSIFGLNLL
jgi:magnesium-transporting ATPase (P-type)